MTEDSFSGRLVRRPVNTLSVNNISLLFASLFNADISLAYLFSLDILNHFSVSSGLVF